MPLNVTAAGNDVFTATGELGEAVGGTIELSCQDTTGGSLLTADRFSVAPLSATGRTVLWPRDGRAE